MAIERGGEKSELEATTDAVLSESAERVRASRELIDEIDRRLAKSNELLTDDRTLDGGQP